MHAFMMTLFEIKKGCIWKQAHETPEKHESYSANFVLRLEHDVTRIEIDYDLNHIGFEYGPMCFE